MKGFNLKAFKLLPPKQQIEWVDDKVEKLIKSLPTLKSKLAMYDDRSSELYNLSSSDIRLMAKIHKDDIARGGGYNQKGLNNFINQLQKYTGKDINEVAKDVALERFESWKNNTIANASSDNEIEYLMELIDKMDIDDIIAFTKSKYFFDYGFPPSDGMIDFQEMFGMSIATTKLELFLNDRYGDDIVHSNYDDIYYQGDGKHKRSSGKRK